MAPRTYRGSVVSTVTGQPLANALVRAQRPGLRGITLFPVGHKIIGTATTDRAGRFVLRTSGGYATLLLASSSDQRQGGTAPPSRRLSGTTLSVSPALRCISYRSIHPDSPEARQADAAIRSIMDEITRENGKTGSLAFYRERGIITPAQFALFENHPHLFFGQDPEITYEWGPMVFLIRDAHSPLRFLPAKSRRNRPR